ncbi:MAG: helix-turn-helix domain-containing protein [Gammaproteobacteria bacterium]|nr:helix-turn-helix domain-containing protein [Gammaproteobacteria bacterium]
MTAETEIYELARQNRDPRFDGRFFVGVLTTGIYCRPVCPVRIPRRENVQLYPSAAAAAAAGFRPCLRCRPETSPGTPAWLGSSFTVSRALQLIAQGALDDDPVEDLASQMGISVRQLNRLFRQHIGATPKAVLQTRRLHFAKQLLDETRLPVSEVCFAAGFGSVRRFNDVIKQTWGMSPRALRQRRRQSILNADGLTVRLTYRPPFDWQSMLEFFSRRAIPSIEWVNDRCYQRSFMLENKGGCITCSFEPKDHVVLLQVNYPDSSQLLNIVERVRSLLDLRADSAWIDRDLAGDSQLAPVVAANPGLRVPGCWDGLEIAVRAIVGQQVSVKAAATLMRRLVERAGLDFPQAAAQTGGRISKLFPDAPTLASAELSGLGITGQRIAAIKSLAQAVAERRLRFDGSQSTGEFCQQICRIKGVGDWTAHYIALRALRDPDAFPHGDLILQRALAPQGQTLPARELLQLAESWRPWRAYAVMLLWRHHQQVQAGLTAN